MGRDLALHVPGVSARRRARTSALEAKRTKNGDFSPLRRQFMKTQLLRFIVGASLAAGLLMACPFQSSAQQFTPTGSLNVARVGASTTILNNGLVLVAGGNDAGTIVASAELYSPATGRFALTGSMGSARVGHTATLLSNGTVLVAGGSNNSGTLLASAELYDPATGVFSPAGSMGFASLTRLQVRAVSFSTPPLRLLATLHRSTAHSRTRPARAFRSPGISAPLQRLPVPLAKLVEPRPLPIRRK
jgi:hypothetical protein